MAQLKIPSYVELANRLEWPILEIHRLNKGIEPTVNRAIQIAKVLRTTVERLFGDDAQTSPSDASRADIELS